jgi:two-component system, NarL family, sensor kinase
MSRFSCFASWLIFLFLTLVGHGQTHLIDSLKSDIKNSKTDEKLLAAIFALCDQGYSLHPDTLMSYAGHARKLAQKKSDLHDEVKAMYYESYALTNKGLIDSSLNIANSCMEVLKIKVNDPVLLANVLNQKGRCYMRKNNYKEAIEMGYRVIDEAEKCKDTLLQMKGKTLIGWAYLEMGQTLEALSWHLKALRTTDDTSLQVRYGILFANLALNYNGLKKTDSALYYIGKAIDYSRRHENLFALSNSLAIQAQLFVTSGQSKLAESPLKEVVTIRKLIGDPFYIVSDMSQLALYYAHNGNAEKGIALCNEGIAIAKAYKIDTKLFFLYSTLAENYKAAGNTAGYAATLEKLLALKDTVYKKNSAEALAEMQTRYEVQKKENLIIRQQLDITKKNYLFYGSLFLLAAGAALSYLFFKEYKKRQKMKMQMMMEAEKLMSTQAVAQAEENQRKRIAADLHDNLGIQANAILYGTELLQQEAGEKEALIKDLHETAKDMLLTLRETLWAMKTADVEVTDMWLRVINFSKQIGRYYPSIKIETTGIAPELFKINSGEALNAMLIMQEAVNNAARHANAALITIASSLNGKNWEIAVTDDGSGFDIEAMRKKQDSYGLINMGDRASIAGLQMEIHTKPLNGTTVFIRMAPI